jgi:hypothetical protein
MTEKEKSSSQNRDIWKDRFWNLFVLLVGAGLGFGLNALHDHIQHKREMETALTLVRQDVAYQVQYCKTLVKGFNNLKSGQFPDIAHKAPTLDRALNNADLRIGMSLRSHRSPISEHIVSRIDLLPKHIATDFLKYYSNIFYCQSLQNECKGVLAQREKESVEKPAPICDIYLDILQSCVKLGEELIIKIEAI